MANKTLVAWDIENITFRLHESLYKIFPSIKKSDKFFVHNDKHVPLTEAHSRFLTSGGWERHLVKPAKDSADRKISDTIRNNLENYDRFVIITGDNGFSEIINFLITNRKHVVLIHNDKSDKLIDKIYSRCLGRDIQKYLTLKNIEQVYKYKNRRRETKPKPKPTKSYKPTRNRTIVAWDIENINFRTHKTLQKILPAAKKSDRFFVHNTKQMPMKESNSNFLTNQGWTKHLVKPGKDSADKKISATLMNNLNNYDKFVIITGDHGFSEIIMFLIANKKQVVLVHNDKSDKLIDKIYSKCLTKDINQYLKLKNVGGRRR